MSNDLISVIDVADHHGKHKQTIFKVLRRLGIATSKRRDSSSGNQLVAYITQEDFRRVSEELSLFVDRREPDTDGNGEADDFVSAEVGVFYLIQLEPKFDPCRFKVGFAANMSDRLRALRCSAPFASVIKTWPCRRLWEKTAIDCVAAGCERLHTEVFRVGSLDEVVSKCEQFFSLMPSPIATNSQPSQEEGYRQMAADEEHEAEALVWSEVLIGDVVEGDDAQWQERDREWGGSR